MRRIVWSTDASVDYRKIIEYIARDDPLAAERIAARIHDVVKGLAAIPTGHKGRVCGTFEKVVPNFPYIIAYALGDEPRGYETITVLRVVHGARDWTHENWPE